MESKRFSLNEAQVKMFFKSLLKYSAPLLLIFLVQLQQGATIQEALPLLYGALLNMAINFLSKYVTETK